LFLGQLIQRMSQISRWHQRIYHTKYHKITTASLHLHLTLQHNGVVAKAQPETTTPLFQLTFYLEKTFNYKLRYRTRSKQKNKTNN